MKQTWHAPQSQRNHKIALCNARILDPYSGLDIIGGIIVENGAIKDLGSHIKLSEISDDFEKIDCGGNLLTPGLIDIQVHFRDPGQSHKEDLHSGSKSAVAGGITRVVCQPNTKPVIDKREIVEYIDLKARDNSYCHIHCYGSISKNMEGKELSNMAEMAQAGVVGFTDDGLPVMNANLMRRSMEYAKTLELPIAQHAEDLNLSNGGCINEGKISYALGVNGIPNISESVIVARDLMLLDKIGGHYHVLHVSTKESLDLIRSAKNIGLNVTCEVAPHHFMLNEEAVLGFNTDAKMNPPLRTEEDRLAMIEGLKDGIFDAIATDHAPHDYASKNLPLSDAAFGIVGLETMLPLSLELYHNKILSLNEVIGLMTYKPANIIKQRAGRLTQSFSADLTLIDLGYDWVIDPHKFASKSKNSPFAGKRVKGRAIMTMVAGKIVYKMEE